MTPDIYREQYKFEWEHRAYLMSSMNLSIAIIAIIGGGLITVARIYTFSESNQSYVVGVLLALSLCSLGFAAFSVFRAMRGYRYQRVPLPSNLEKWKTELTEWHIQYGSISDVEVDLHDGYIAKMCEAVEANAANNTNKSAQLYRANQATGLAAILLIIPAILFVVQDHSLETSPQQVEIVSGKIQVIGDIPVSTENEPQKQPEPQPAAPPPKPPPPQNEFIKEDQVKPETRTDESD